MFTNTRSLLPPLSHRYLNRRHLCISIYQIRFCSLLFRILFLHMTVQKAGVLNQFDHYWENCTCFPSFLLLQMSVLLFDNDPHLQWYLNDYTNKADLLNALTYVPYHNGTTNTGSALKYVRENVFQVCQV
jgi:hypothetical protein